MLTSVAIREPITIGFGWPTQSWLVKPDCSILVATMAEQVFRWAFLGGSLQVLIGLISWSLRPGLITMTDSMMLSTD